MENQEILDQFLENRQNYMLDNMQHISLNVDSAGCEAVVGGVQAEVVSGGGVAAEILCGKYEEHHEEHDVGDDDEWKYVKEVQQSEKQQQQQQHQTLKNFGVDEDGNELVEKDTFNVAHEFGNGNGDFVFGGDHHHHRHEVFTMGNGHNANGDDNNDNLNLNKSFEEKHIDNEKNNFENDGELSSASRVTETVENFVPQVDVKIETNLHAEQQEMCDEEEPSSLATNTTNGTSSLSENAPPQTVNALETNAFDDFMTNLDKEKADASSSQRPNDLDLVQGHYQLNPEAKEFIPSFGSNPASPTSPFAEDIQPNDPVLSDAADIQMYFGQAPSAVPRRLLSDDDLVAQSPRKGKGDNNMDTVSLPRELSEFEEEADKRPHELTPDNVEAFQQKDEVMTPDQVIQQLPLDDLAQDENITTSYSTEYQSSNFIDHGPETCVDIDVDLDLQQSKANASLQNEDDDVMKRSMYVASEDAIEDVLNSVQPIPTEIDSVNNSFIEESATESVANQLACDKELLQVEEKEHVSHSPSTEEIQMNLRNTLNSSNKDIPQLPIDMDNANNMQESMYMKQEQQQHQEQEQLYEKQYHEQQYQEEELRLHEEQKHQVEEHNFDEEQLEEKQHQEEEQHINEELKHRNQPEEQHDFYEELRSEKQSEEQLFEESHHELQKNHDQPLQDVEAMQTEITEESLLADTTNPFSANDGFLDNSFEKHELRQEIQESSLFKVIGEDLADPVLDSLNFGSAKNQQILSDMTSIATDEKHLIEETKEQRLFPIPDLEQQTNEMILNNDDHISQVKDIVSTPATVDIEDVSEKFISPDEDVVQDQHQEELQHQEKTLVEESINSYEQETIHQQQETIHQQEETIHQQQETIHQQQETIQQQQNEQHQFEQDADKETEQEHEIEHANEVTESPISEYVQQQQEVFESEMIGVEEPKVEAKQSTTLFTIEETEFVNVTKQIKEEKQEQPSDELPETTLNDLVETAIDVTSKTETIRNEEEQSKLAEDISAEPIKEPEVKEMKVEEEESVKQEIVETPMISQDDKPVEVAAVAVAVAAATTAAVAAATTAAVAAKAAASPSKKTEDTKKPLGKSSSIAGKPKVGATLSAASAKKPTETTKKPAALTAKPRPASAKPATTATDKKPLSKTPSTSTATRKPLSAGSTSAPKAAAKTTTTRVATTTAKTTAPTKPTSAPRTVPSTTTTTRKPSATSTTANGPSAKPRSATAPPKPTTLGLSATNGVTKTKVTSPRATLTSQLRKTTPPLSGSGTKSPVKSTGTNGVAKTASSTLASTRTKTTTSTVSNSVGTSSKSFTARPAPKFTSSASSTTTTTASRRLTVGGTTTATSTTTITKTTTTPLRKSSPAKAAGKTLTKSTPSSAGGKKSTTPITKQSPPTKPAPIRKPVDKTVTTNGEINVNKELNGTAEKIATPADEQQSQSQNGDVQAVQQQQQQQQQNGDTNIPMQAEELDQKSLIEHRDDQIPMNLINA